MPTTVPDLWDLVHGRPWVDPEDLAAAIEEQVRRGDLDFRSRLLIRDSLEALRDRWGLAKLEVWLSKSGVRDQLDRIRKEELGEPGFPSLARRLMETLRPETIWQFLRELGQHVRRSTPFRIGGVVALILPGLVSRNTEDVDVVDEVPAELRVQHALLEGLAQRYGLHLGHFQSHYLPSGWEQRLHSEGSVGQLQVFLVDPYDVFLSKLFGAREKDRDDLRAVAPQLDKETLVRRLKETTASLQAEERFRQQAEQNWYIIFGEALPS
jgi:hypothetical protein